MLANRFCLNVHFLNIIQHCDTVDHFLLSEWAIDHSTTCEIETPDALLGLKSILLVDLGVVLRLVK